MAVSGDCNISGDSWRTKSDSGDANDNDSDQTGDEEEVDVAASQTTLRPFSPTKSDSGDANDKE
jgi:hypothetical protein